MITKIILRRIFYILFIPVFTVSYLLLTESGLQTTLNATNLFIDGKIKAEKISGNIFNLELINFEYLNTNGKRKIQNISGLEMLAATALKKKKK